MMTITDLRAALGVVEPPQPLQPVFAVEPPACADTMYCVNTRIPTCPPTVSCEDQLTSCQVTMCPLSEPP
jgi:hypothetical protein